MRAIWGLVMVVVLVTACGAAGATGSDTTGEPASEPTWVSARVISIIPAGRRQKLILNRGHSHGVKQGATARFACSDVEVKVTQAFALRSVVYVSDELAWETAKLGARVGRDGAEVAPWCPRE